MFKLMYISFIFLTLNLMALPSDFQKTKVPVISLESLELNGLQVLKKFDPEVDLKENVKVDGYIEFFKIENAACTYKKIKNMSSKCGKKVIQTQKIF